MVIIICKILKRMYFIKSISNHYSISEKNVKLENELTNLIQEAGTKVNLEVDKVKTMYKAKLREANVEIEFLRTVCIINAYKILN